LNKKKEELVMTNIKMIYLSGGEKKARELKAPGAERLPRLDCGLGIVTNTTQEQKERGGCGRVKTPEKTKSALGSVNVGVTGEEGERFSSGT